MIFEPNEVQKDSWKLWFKEGLALSSRRPVMFVVLVLGYGCLTYLPEPLEALFLFLIPLILGAGCVLACCADGSLGFVEALRAKPAVVWFRLAMVGTAPWALLWAFFSFLSFFVSPNESPVIHGSSLSFLYEPGTVMLFFMFLWLVLANCWIWFLVPLLAVAELPLWEAFAQSADAVGLNGFALWVAVLNGLSCVAGLFCSVLVFPWYAVIVSMMYASFRHIWLGRGKNQSVRRLPQAETSEAHV